MASGVEAIIGCASYLSTLYLIQSFIEKLR